MFRPSAKSHRLREEKFAALRQSWAVGSVAFRAEIRVRLKAVRAERFLILGADRDAVRAARMELWEEQLRILANAFGIALDRLPRKKSAVEKLTLAARSSRPHRSRAWLAQRLQMGASDSLSSLLHRFRASGGTTTPAFTSILSGFRT